MGSGRRDGSNDRSDPHDNAVARDEVCVVALADAFRGDGEILCHPMGVVPVCAGRLARATFEPDLMLTDTVSTVVANTVPIGRRGDDPIVEGYLPFRSVFDVTWSGRRHVVMGASQIDMWGNQNIAAIGDPARPKVQLLGMRGAPGNAVNHPVTYWIPHHSRNVFVDAVDVVSAPGYDRVSALPPVAARSFEIRRVVTNLAVFDFASPDKRMRLVSCHPGVSVDDVLDATSFELVIDASVPTTRSPSAEEVRLIREVIDPDSLRMADF